MKYQIIGKNIEVTEAIRDDIERKAPSHGQVLRDHG